MMVSKTFGVLFFFKKSKQEVSGKQPIYLRITVDGKRVELFYQKGLETRTSGMSMQAGPPATGKK
jgi:hypothetical protein